MKTKLFNSLALFLVLAVSTFAQATFSVDESDGRNHATFESNAPLEDIIGVSNKINVMIMLDPADFTNNPKGKVSVDLNALKTGIELRDDHLRSENWLNTEKYPYAEFMLGGISNSSSKDLKDGKKVKVTLHGKFSVHGVTKDISVPAELTYFHETEKTITKIAGNLLKARAEFEIKLSDYGIEIPSMVVGKVDDKIKISMNYIASDANGGMMACNPCGMKHEKSNPCGMKNAKCNPCGLNK